VTRDESMEHLQHMHTTQTVSRESIIAWYTFYRDKLPTMNPDRSEVDLIRTVALWMQLTDQGGAPRFPWDYQSTLSFPEMLQAQTNPGKPSPVLPIAVLLLLGGLVAFFVSKDWALPLLLGGIAALYFGYKLQGGATNAGLMVPRSTLYEQEGRRVVEWAASHSAAR
jgi:hypothetical protein